MMKVKSMLGLAFSLLVLTAPDTQAEEKITAKFNMMAGPKHPVSQHAITPFIAQVAELTGNTLQIQPFFGGTLFGGQESLDGVKSGGAEMGYVVMGYYPAALRYGSLLSDLAMVGSEPAAVSAAMSELILLHCQPCQEEFKAQNVVYMGGHSTSVYAIMSKDPIVSLDDLKGKKIRTAGSVWDRWLKSVGAVPVNMPTTDMYDALNRGIISGLIAAPSSLRSHSLWDVAKYLIEAPLGTYPAAALVMVNRDFYRSLSPKQRRAVLEATAYGTFAAPLGYIKHDKEVMDAAKSKGVKIQKLDESAQTNFAAFVQEDLKTLSTSAQQRLSIPDPSNLFSKYQELYAKWSSALPDADATDPKKAAEMFKREVVSKIDVNSYGL